jgi:hypothetical protein
MPALVSHAGSWGMGNPSLPVFAQERFVRQVHAWLEGAGLPGLRQPDHAVAPHHVPAAAVGNVPVAIVRRMSVSACRFRSL